MSSGPPGAIPPPGVGAEDENSDELYYGPIYRDSQFEYRHLVFPGSFRNHTTLLNADGNLLMPSEMRKMGAIVDPGWQHCFWWHAPRQPPTLILRRHLDFPDEETGLHDAHEVIGVDREFKPLGQMHLGQPKPDQPQIDEETVQTVLDAWKTMQILELHKLPRSSEPQMNGCSKLN